MNINQEDRQASKNELLDLECYIEYLEESGANHADIAVQVNKHKKLEEYLKGKKDSPITNIETLKQ